MNKADLKIKIYTRSLNCELYHYSQKTLHCKYPRVRRLATTADGYLYDMVADTSCDIAINIDEDAFVVNQKALDSLVEYVIQNDIACAGMPDGGLLPIRGSNPIVVNPFFNVFNLDIIRTDFDRKTMEQFDYHSHRAELEAKFPKGLLRFDNGGFDKVDIEPFDRFFQWLAYNHKVLYLNATEHSDGFTTILHNHADEPFLYHTWYSRLYGFDKTHTKRIDNIISEVYEMQDGRKWHRSRLLRYFSRIELKLIRFRENHYDSWLVRHLTKSPKHYLGRLKEAFRNK